MLVGGNKWETGFYIPDTVNPSTPDAYVTILRKIYGDAIGDKVAAAYPFSSYSSGWEAVTTATSDFCPRNPVVGSFAVALCNDVRTCQLAVTAGGAPVYGFIFADLNAPPRGPVPHGRIAVPVPDKYPFESRIESTLRYHDPLLVKLHHLGQPERQRTPDLARLQDRL